MKDTFSATEKKAEIWRQAECDLSIAIILYIISCAQATSI